MTDWKVFINCRLIIQRTSAAHFPACSTFSSSLACRSSESDIRACIFFTHLTVIVDHVIVIVLQCSSNICNVYPILWVQMHEIPLQHNDYIPDLKRTIPLWTSVYTAVIVLTRRKKYSTNQPIKSLGCAGNDLSSPNDWSYPRFNLMEVSGWWDKPSVYRRLPPKIAYVYQSLSMLCDLARRKRTYCKPNQSTKSNRKWRACAQDILRNK